MKVRDLALPKTEYKGRLTVAVDALCPCRPCWHPHDCGRLNSQGKWVMNMYCATNWNNGCPPKEKREAVHTIPEGKRKCSHCGIAKPTKKDIAKLADHKEARDEEGNHSKVL